jgi:hypothetical protein
LPGDVARSLAGLGSSMRPVRTATKPVKAGYTPRLEFRGRLKPGYYAFGLRLTAALNPARAHALVSRVFRVGAPITRR